MELLSHNVIFNVLVYIFLRVQNQSNEWKIPKNILKAL
jgi:hypothetical protein